MRGPLYGCPARVILWGSMMPTFSNFDFGRRSWRHLAHSVRGLYFAPKYDEFRPQTIWKLDSRELRYRHL
jgi:hypothetical protein